MRTRLATIALILLLGGTLHAQRLDWLGAQKMGGTGKDRGDGLVIDHEGNMILAGSFIGSASFAGLPLVGRGATDGYILKLNSQGAAQWVRGIGGTNDSASAMVRGVCADSSGNIYVTGSFSGSINFLGTPLRATGSADVFTAKLNPFGNLLWVRQSKGRTSPFGSLGVGVGASIAVDKSGNAYITGTVMDSVYFEGTGVYSGFSDVFLAKYNAAGALQWVRSGGGELPDNGLEVAVDPSGNPVMAGFFVDSARFGNISISGYQWEDVFLAKYDQNGNVLWVRHGGSYDLDLVLGLAVDAAGNIYMSGIYTMPAVFGSATLPVNGLYDLFLVKYNSAGVFQWAERTSGFGDEIGGPMVADAAGNTYVVGSFGGPGRFGDGAGGELQSQGNGDVFVVKHDPDGAFQWVRAGGSGITDSAHAANAVALGSAGDIFVAGLFYGKANFGSVLLQSSGNSDIFLARLGDPGSFPSISGSVYEDINGDGIYDAAESGLPHRMIEVTPGPIYATTDSNGQYRLYLDPGTYTLSQVVERYWRHTAPAAPGTHTVAVTDGDSASDRDFGTQALPGINDLKVSVTNLWPARPGFEQYYLIAYKNQGTTTLDGAVSFTYDPHLVYDIAEPEPSAHEGNTLSWNFEDLLPGEARGMIVNMALSPEVGLDVGLLSHADIEPLSGDTIPGDNHDTLAQITQGSYDPNDIQVFPWDIEAKGIVYPDEKLTYIIRFQNTGTDTAFKVVVIDTLDSDLDVTSFEMIAASHPYTYEITEGGIVTWTFDGINLPDLNRDEPGSHGMIRFEIHPKKGLKNGTQMHNRAAIYFDFNKPVITNTVVSVMTGVSSVFEAPKALDLTHYLFPVPLRNSSTLKLEGGEPGPYTITIHDEAARVVRTLENVEGNQIVIDRGDLVPGVYFYTVRAAGVAVARGKMVVE